jgi:glyoxylase-like metal-dependent hydrolase (beta-lactamase superfamily II)
VRVDDFTEVADRVWVARHSWLDVNVTAVLGERGVLLVDTLGSVAAAEAMLARLRGVTAAPLLAVINIHAHWDHLLGNAAARADSPAVTLLAHEDAADRMPAVVAEAGDDPRRAGIDDARVPEVRDSPLLVPEETFSSVRALDLGDRYVEVVHCGRGHTDGDVVVRVPDVDVLVAGDLVEQGAPPSYGEDCWPLDWPTTLETLGQMTTPGSVVVPGHGAPVDQGFLQEQHHAVGVVAETVLDLAGGGASVAKALAHDDWPYPADALVHAVRRGYEHMPRAARRLPMA